ncbi:MAG: hypothetical protein EXX96DRAFT_590459 [Benjaminiella poitrasii]|nr:MAG: hypothetical protein EXX96DRAFT_590459 [Benjaminiella poitrasii]
MSTVNITYNLTSIETPKKRGRKPSKIKQEASDTTIKKSTKGKKSVVKKESKVNTEKKKRTKKRTYKLPPEASIYLDDAKRGRVLRAMKERLFVLERKQIDPNDNTIEEFNVLGSVGNYYTVKFAQKMSCDCMDHRIRRGHCKHILMILLKVYRLAYDSPLFHSLKTTKEERLTAKNSQVLVDPSILVPLDIRQKILSLTNKNQPNSIIDEKNTVRRPLDTSDCPICFEVFEEADINEIVFCQICGNNIHEQCFNMWKQSKGGLGNVSCVYCRSKWVSSNRPSSKKSALSLDKEHMNEGTPNFAKELGISRTRDYSTYKTRNGYNFM